MIRPRLSPTLRCRQRGAVAVVVGLTIFVLVGMIGLALDLGQMFVNKTELQNAADACALAAARELDGNTDALVRGDAAGILVASQNRVGFQGAAVAIEADDITYSDQLSPNSAYSNNADPATAATARFAMCTVRRTDIGMWFMGVFGRGDQTVGAYAVATLAPAQTTCALPIGFCQNNDEANPCATEPYGLCIGDWRKGRFAAGLGSFGAFGWIDFTGKGGGTRELKDLLITGMCEIEETGTVERRDAKPGEANAAAFSWNSRFGLYKNGLGNPSPSSDPPAPPDFSGFSYTTTPEGIAAWPAQRDALDDFLARRTTNDPYQGDTATGLKLPQGLRPSLPQQHNDTGTDRRIVPVPIIDCDAGSPSKVYKIENWACVLLLHPISNPTDDLSMEYLGLASMPGTPCSSFGLAGGSIGPLVPVLVQ